MMYLTALLGYARVALGAVKGFVAPIWNNPVSRYVAALLLSWLAMALYGMHRENRGREAQKKAERRKDAETLERIEHASIDAVAAADRIRDRMRPGRVRDVPEYVYRDDSTEN